MKALVRIMWIPVLISMLYTGWVFWQRHSAETAPKPARVERDPLAEYGTTGVQTFEACRHLGIPLVVHFHGFDASERATLQEHATTYPALFAGAAAVIAVSRAMQRQLVSLGASPQNVHYNPCGVNCEEFKGADPARVAPIFLAVENGTEDSSTIRD